MRVRPEQTPAAVTRATERIMAAITTLVAELRGEPAPMVRHDITRTGDRPTGDPRGRGKEGR